MLQLFASEKKHGFLSSAPPQPKARTSAPPVPSFSNQARLVGRSNGSAATVQPKLAVSSPGDVYEREADQVAKQVMQMPAAPAPQCACASGPDSCPTCAGECQGQLLRKDAEAGDVRSSAHDEVLKPLGPGRPLDGGLREFFEPRFGQDFGQVRIHTDESANESARSLNAMAYTLGRDIVFGAGHYSPNTSQGRQLLAHELTHVVQQGRSDSPTSDSPPIIARQAELGDAITQVEEEDKQPGEVDPSDAAAIGQEALSSVGYDELIRLAIENGLLERKEATESSDAPVQRSTASPAATIFRQGAEALTFGAVFTRYAIAAGVTSQLDSPAPGPADVVALGILVVGLAVATYTVASRGPCDIQLVNCLENVWQPDWNRGTYGPRKDCGACYRECKNAGGAWPYYKCPA